MKKRILSIALALCMLLSVLPLTSFAAATTTTATSTTVGAFTVTGGTSDTDYAYDSDSGVLTVKSATALTVKNTDPSKATTDRIKVESGVSANLTLAGVNIDVSSDTSACAFEIVKDTTGNVTLTLADNTQNTLISGGDRAGLEKEGIYTSSSSGKLTIQCVHSSESGHTCNTSCGKLTASSTNGAGIGSGYAQNDSGDVSNIAITGGYVIASSTNSGAGIGSGFTVGDSGNVSNITITGGYVIASSTNSGAGIGSGYASGYSGDVSNITISGGCVTASSIKGGGIGSGYGYGYSGDVSNITISGGCVTASSIKGGGIGSGCASIKYGDVSNITITGGSIKASGKTAIGKGDGTAVTPTDGNGNNVYLEGHSMNNPLGYGIENPNGYALMIDGVVYPTGHTYYDFDSSKWKTEKTVYPYLSSNAHTQFIGTDKTVGALITRLDNDRMAFTVTYTADGTSAVHGEDYFYDQNDNGKLYIVTDRALTIKNKATSTATADRIVVPKCVSANLTLAGVNIDVSLDNNACAFEIASNTTGNVTLTLADNSSNILKSGPSHAGLEKEGISGSLTIQCAHSGESGHACNASCGKLTASSGSGGVAGAGAGIGSGYAIEESGDVTNITVTGGYITASGGGAGIGSGYAADNSGDVSNITITGGCVTVDGTRSAGIGSGFANEMSGDVSNITITGGCVTASSEYSSGIGSGYASGFSGDVSNITISGGSVKASLGSTPTDGKGNNVYLYTIDNPDGKAVTVNGIAYPKAHTYYDGTAWTSETKLYPYVPHSQLTITVGDTTTEMLYNNDTEQFEKATYTVTYAAGQYGTGSAQPDTKISGEPLTLNDASFTRTGYTQTGWATTDGGAKVYDLGGSYTANAPVTLYPVWTINQYTITVKPENGDKDITIKQDYGTTVTAPTLTKDGYAFDGWDKVFPTTMPAESVTITAKWTDITAPVISGITNGETYCEAQEVTVSDNDGIASVTVNGTPITPDNKGKLTLSPAEGEQKIVVTDKAGNKTEMTVTVNDGHTYEWKTENGQYWKKCKFCGDETAKKDIPEITINGADNVCVTQDYIFTVTVPEGSTDVMYGYDFANKGDGGIKITPVGGIYSKTLTSDMLENESSFVLSVVVTTADGYTVSTSKTVQILSEHTGGTATCTEKAKCEVCGEPYGTTNPDNHTGKQHLVLKNATATTLGNIEYWYCKDCDKCFSDSDYKNSISKESTYLYAVVFDTDGANGIATKTAVKWSDNVLDGVTAPTKAGWDFIGWKCGNKDVTEKTTYDDLALSKTSASVELEAQWNSRAANTLVLHGNGGLTSSSSDIYTSYAGGASIKVSSVPFTKKGYYFNAWNTKADGKGQWYRKGETVNFTAVHNGEKVELYAIWEANYYTIVFDSNGAEGTMKNLSMRYDQTANLTANAFTRDGYEFVSWNTSPDGKGTEYTNGQEVLNLTDVSKGTVTLYAQWKDVSNPSGSITVGENSWNEFLNTITFGLFFKDTQEVTVTATDNSGEDVTVEYLLSDKELSETELATATFTAYTGKFNIEPNNEYVIYAKLTDKSDNVAYLSSNGIVLDNIAPVISGVEDGKTYCSVQTVTVSDKYDVTVTVNDKPVTLTNGQFTLSAAEGEQKIVVTDKAGNKTEMTVTVNDGHTVGTATCTEKAKCEVCGEVYGEVNTSNHTTLKHVEAKTATTEAEGNIEYWHCEDCGKYFSDKDGKNEIELADTVIAKLVKTDDDNKSPQTGDNSHIALWFTLLFVSGGALAGTGLYGKKKKRFEK